MAAIDGKDAASPLACLLKQNSTRFKVATGVETLRRVGWLAHLSTEAGVDVVGACLTSKRGIGLLHCGQKTEVARDVWNQWLQTSDHPASCHEADEGNDHVVN